MTADPRVTNGPSIQLPPEGIPAMERRDLIKCALIASAPTALLGRASAASRSHDTSAIPDGRLTAPLTVPESGDIRAAFLISPGAEVVDFAGPWGVFQYVTTGEANHSPFKLYTVAASKDPVKVTGGMTLLPDYTYADSPAPDVLVVPATDTDKLAPNTFDWLRSVHKGTAVTMSVCNGSYVLAAARLLDGKTATAHHGSYGMLRAMYPKVTVIRGVRFVEDGRIATSGGLTSGMDLAMRVVERYFGRGIAQQTALKLEYQGTGWMFPASNAQFAAKPVGTALHPVCPVCESQISREAALAWEYHGKTYLLCSQFCKGYFMADPQRYIDAA
jgi:putative intracellular protease/amidase/YHS domain-containing protein